jgi:Rrf2 family nitric oxide-sensitive transcriptional repressor
MELTLYTDYALRVLMYLSVRGETRSNISDIAQRYHISRNHLVKVVHGLARGGFIQSYRGKGGGIALAREPREIGIGDVVRHTEGPLRPAECFRGAENQCVITGACMLTGILREACDNFLATLDRYTLADLLAKRSRLNRQLHLRSEVAYPSS